MTASPGAEGRERLRFQRSRRITRGADIRELFRRGKRSKTAHLDVFDSSSPVSFPRAALVVPRHRQSAVDRNRLKRRLREILRTEVLPGMVGADLQRDILVRARREAYGATYQELRGELLTWAGSRAAKKG